jgi:hypothetical protein
MYYFACCADFRLLQSLLSFTCGAANPRDDRAQVGVSISFYRTSDVHFGGIVLIAITATALLVGLASAASFARYARSSGGANNLLIIF